MPDGSSTCQAGHVFHRFVVVVTEPDGHCDLRRKTNGPVVAEVVSRSRLGRNAAIFKEQVAVSAKGGGAGIVI